MLSCKQTASVILLISVMAVTGCCFKRDCMDLCSDAPCRLPPADPGFGPTQLERADACLSPDCGGAPQAEYGSPYDLDENALGDDRLQEVSLEECIQQALSNSKIMRDLGATILRAPQTVTSMLDPAIVYSDPRVGEEAALSAFDANFFALTNYEHNRRQLNNQFFGTNGFFRQDLSVTQFGFNKRSVTGGQFSVRNVTTYDVNNQQSNLLGPRSWEDYVEGEVRQPLLLGAGTEFNRLAGPGSSPGQLNGVLLSRVRTDISLTEFERSVRDLVAEVENAYWDLYYAYRDLEAKVQVRDIAAETFRLKQNKKKDESELSQAAEQVARFESDVLDALNGRPVDGTRTNNGSAGGTFRGTGGIRVAERKLRLITGMSINDGRLLKPSASPNVAPVMFDWNLAIQEALERREELRRQRWIVKQRELELAANRGFLKPQLDLVSRYRVRGFGKDLLNADEGALNDLFGSDLQEWAMALEYNVPVGYRRAHAAVRNSQLGIAREVEILVEQERLVHFGLSNAINECSRSWNNMVLQEKRLDAIVKQLNVIKNKSREGEEAQLDVELETQRRLLDARIRYHQAQVEYQLALRNVHFEKGSLLDYNNVQLAESIAPTNAYTQANNRIDWRDHNFAIVGRDPVISKTAAAQQNEFTQPVSLDQPSVMSSDLIEYAYPDPSVPPPVQDIQSSPSDTPPSSPATPPSGAQPESNGSGDTTGWIPRPSPSAMKVSLNPQELQLSPDFLNQPGTAVGGVQSSIGDFAPLPSLTPASPSPVKLPSASNHGSDDNIPVPAALSGLGSTTPPTAGPVTGKLLPKNFPNSDTGSASSGTGEKPSVVSVILSDSEK